jgi:hypothetical protein
MTNNNANNYCAMDVSAWLALERQLQVAAAEKPPTALPATTALGQFCLARVAKRSAERFPGSQSKPLVHFEMCMCGGGGVQVAMPLYSVDRTPKGEIRAPGVRLALHKLEENGKPSCIDVVIRNHTQFIEAIKEKKKGKWFCFFEADSQATK